MAETVLVEESGGIRTLTLHRPEQRNALTPQMQEELIAELRAAAGSAGCRAVVLTGAGETFCAGLDLRVASRGEGKDAGGKSADDARRLALLFRTLYECAKPTVAVVRGAAVAGGAGLAGICDFTLAETAAWFAYTEVKIGFVPALVSAYLVLHVGEKRARDLLLTGRRVDAVEALRLGLVNEVAPREALMGRAYELAAVLQENSPEALRATKALLAEQSREWLDEAEAEALAVHARARGTADFREGVAAFLEKRKPVWRA